MGFLNEMAQSTQNYYDHIFWTYGHLSREIQFFKDLIGQHSGRTSIGYLLIFMNIYIPFNILLINSKQDQR